MRFALFTSFVLLASPALAADSVSLKSDVFVARDVRDAAGKVRTVPQSPQSVTPGDRLLFVLNYKNQGTSTATSFTATNPIPAAVTYADGASAGEVVSVDRGKSWGALATLRVLAAGGAARPATMADVTHIR